jgi:hypothetical protein
MLALPTPDQHHHTNPPQASTGATAGVGVSAGRGGGADALVRSSRRLLCRMHGPSWEEFVAPGSTASGAHLYYTSPDGGAAAHGHTSLNPNPNPNPAAGSVRFEQRLKVAALAGNADAAYVPLPLPLPLTYLN